MSPLDHQFPVLANSFFFNIQSTQFCPCRSTLFPIHYSERGISSWLPLPNSFILYMIKWWYQYPLNESQTMALFSNFTNPSGLFLFRSTDSLPTATPQISLSNAPTPKTHLFWYSPHYLLLTDVPLSCGFSLIARAFTLSSVVPEVFSFFHLN